MPGRDPDRPRTRTCVAALVALTAAFVGCREAAPPPTARHIVLVTLDTLRADHVGRYGAEFATPNLDRLADEGAYFVNANTHVPLTRPAHVSMFTGLLPLETGVRDNVSAATVPEVPTLAEVLREAGFETAAFVSSVVLSSASELDRGFGTYGDDLQGDPSDPAFLNRAQRRGDLTLADALAWLESRGADSRLFLWLHLYDPHEPYEPPEPWATRFSESPYAGEVAWTDDLVGRLDDSLTRSGRADDTLLVVTSDHGEGLGDHDELLHGFFAYESTLRIPLIVRGPGIAAGTVIASQAGLVDLYPTLLELAGVEPPPEHAHSGRSHAAELRGGEPPEPAPLYAETLVPQLRFGWSDLRAVRRGKWKWIRAPRPELYDLESDPGETDNVVRSHRREAHELDRILDSFLAREIGATAESQTAEVIEQLAALGYLGTVQTTGEDAGADPKDKVGDFRFANDGVRTGLQLLHAGGFEESAARFAALLDRGIDSAEIRLYLGEALLGANRLERAAEEFAAAAAAHPGNSRAWLGLADASSRLGDRSGALAALHTGRQADPDNAAFWREEARLLRASGRDGEARAALAAAIERAPDDPFLRAALSELLWDTGDRPRALDELRRATELGPRNPRYWNALGQRLGELERFSEAEPAFAQAVSLAPGDPRYAFNLALAVARQERLAEARPLFERALELDPAMADARAWLRHIDTAPAN